MYEEPYRWIEAVENRRQYLDEQFRQGSPVVALSYADGIVLLTVSRGTPKLYEVYDRIGLAGMGHPADLEKLRFSLLEAAHVEGFNRSPSDVTAGRLMKYSLAPAIKQAFEEIYKAPFIVKILLAELNRRTARNAQSPDAFVTVDYDGSFEETTGFAVLAARPAVRSEMAARLNGMPNLGSLPLDQAMEIALMCWALGSLRQSAESQADESGPSSVDDARLGSHLREMLADRVIECAVMERQTPGPSKYRTLTKDELVRFASPYLAAKP